MEALNQQQRLFDELEMSYTFISDIIDSSIVVQSDNIMVDGTGYILQGQVERGIDLSYRSDRARGS